MNVRVRVPLSFIRTHVLSRAVRCGLPAYVRLEMNVYERRVCPSVEVRRCTYVSEGGQMFFNVRTFNVRLIVVAVRMYVYNVCIYMNIYVRRTYMYIYVRTSMSSYITDDGYRITIRYLVIV